MDTEKQVDQEMAMDTQPEQDTSVAESPETDSSDTERILEAISGLQKCFDDKIAHDSHQNELFDNMHQELVRYQNGVLDKLVETIALDIIQLIDNTGNVADIYATKEPSEENYRRLIRMVKGLAEDLQDILYRQNIEAYSVDGDYVDVRRQKIIQTLKTEDPDKDNRVAVRVGSGYEKEGKILRPERIKIYKYTPVLSEKNENM